MKKSLWFKIITIIVIQAILLTQADFAMASIFSSKDLCQEAASRYQKITTKAVSLIFGICCLQLNSNSLQLERLFSLLTSDSFKSAEILSQSKLRIVNNEIYKVFGLLSIQVYEYNNDFAVLSSSEVSIDSNWMALTQQVRAPPMIVKNFESIFFGRIV